MTVIITRVYKWLQKFWSNMSISDTEPSGSLAVPLNDQVMGEN